MIFLRSCTTRRVCARDCVRVDNEKSKDSTFHDSRHLSSSRELPVPERVYSDAVDKDLHYNPRNEYAHKHAHRQTNHFEPGVWSHLMLRRRFLRTGEPARRSPSTSPSTSPASSATNLLSSDLHTSTSTWTHASVSVSQNIVQKTILTMQSSSAEASTVVGSGGKLEQLGY